MVVKKGRAKGKGAKKWSCKCGQPEGIAGCVYFLAFIGATVYYIGQADGFWVGVLGILKALIWPAMLIHEVFTRLAM